MGHTWNAHRLLLFIGFFLPGRQILTSCEPYLVWTQKTHMWARLRGIRGSPSDWVPSGDRTYVGSVPDWNRTWHALTYDPVSHHVYWHDQSQYAFYRQPRQPCLLDKTSEDLQVVFRQHDQVITGIALDWNTKALYYTDDYNNLLGVTGIGTGLSRDVHQVLFSTGIDKPVGIVVQPDQGLMYWLDVGTLRIERATLFGTHRETLFSGTELEGTVDLNIDHQENCLYWSRPGRGIWRMFLHSNQVDMAASFAQTNIMGLAVYQDYMFVGNRGLYSIDIYEKTGAFHSNYIIDANPYKLAILEETRSPSSDCTSLRCEQLCLLNDLGTNVCVCGVGYQLQVDGRSCHSSKHSPRYIYSRGSTVWLSQSTIRNLNPSNVALNDTLVSRDKRTIQPIGFHYDQNLVYMGDTEADVLYRTTAEGSFELELTVNTRQSEGISVDWLTNTVYWSDFHLRHIMCAQLDGRFHRIVLEHLDGPRGLAVDPSHGVMFWANDGASKGLLRARLDGTRATTVTTQDVFQPQGITADARHQRLYWTDRYRNHIVTVNYDGSNRRVLLQGTATRLYDSTVFKDYVTYTEGSELLKFAYEKTGERLVSVSHSYGSDISTLTFQNTYDVVAFDSYLQPQANNLCATNNGACQQLCSLVPPADDPSTTTSPQCACAIGFQLNDDNMNCHSTIDSGNFMLFTDPYHKQVYQLDLGGQKSVQGVTLPRQDFPVSIDVDPVEGRIFWIDRLKFSISSSTFYGYEERRLWYYGQGVMPERLAVDYSNRHLYVTDSYGNRILRLPLDATDVPANSIVTVVSNQMSPFALELDVDNEFLYWTNKGSASVSRMSLDGTALETLATGVHQPSGVVITALANNKTVAFWSDQTSGSIQMYDTEDHSITQIYQNTSLQINTLAADATSIYFTAWNEKGVFRVSMADPAAGVHLMGLPVFARIYDLHVYPGEMFIPVPVSSIPVLYIGLAILAFVILALLIAAIAFAAVAARRRSVPEPKSQNPDNTYMNTGFEEDMPDFTNPRGGLSTLTNGHPVQPNGTAPPPPPPLPGSSVPPPPIPSMMGGVPVVGMLPLPAAGAARKVKRRRGKELPAPASDNDNSFQLSGNAQATVIQRLANRLRNRLSSVRFSKRNSGENWDPVTDPDLSDDDNLPPENRKPEQRANIRVQPQLHRPPRGYAPASHAVPQTVKSTWSRAKAAIMLNKR